MRRATIGLDCRLGGIRHGGIGRYISEYLRRAARDPALDFTIVGTDQSQLSELLTPIAKQDRARIHAITAPMRHYSLAEQWQLPRVLQRLSIDLLHVPHFNVPLGYHRPFVVTIHDLLWHSTKGTTVTTLPPWQYWLKYAAYQWVVKNAVTHAQAVFVPTQFVAQTISRHYPVARRRTVVTYEGVGEQFQPATKAERQPHQLLYVGSLYPHKNVTVVLDALLQLPTETLVVVGARDVFSQVFTAAVRERGLSDRVRLLHQLSDRELVELYQSSSLLIQPSTSEGFGLTGVEALACGTPLIASDIPVFHEVYGAAAFFFDPHDPDQLADMIRTAQDPQSQPEPRAIAAVLERCSWDRMTDVILSRLKQLTS